MHDGAVDGMQTFDDEIEKLWNSGMITKETALAYATNPTNLALRLTDAPEPARPEGERTATRCCRCWSSHDSGHLYELPEAALDRRDQLADEGGGFSLPRMQGEATVDRRQFESAVTPSAAAPTHMRRRTKTITERVGAKALIVGVDHPALRQASKLVGYLPVFHADAAKAREFFNQEIPQIVFLHPAQMTAPPLEAIAPIVSVIPSERGDRSSCSSPKTCERSTETPPFSTA